MSAQATMTSEPQIINVHTPTSSFAIPHSLAQESLENLYDKLSRKVNTGAKGLRVGAGWLKYEWNDAVWNLDDDSDYTIFSWRQKSLESEGSSSPTLHLHNPQEPLPDPPAYTNQSYYLFKRPSSPAPSHSRVSHRRRSSVASGTSRKSLKTVDDGVPQFKKEFLKFHSENGVRTVLGSIGPVQGVRMLLKEGYRHVYMSRNFAIKHGFIPADAAPGSYGYGGLINIGQWPITVGRTKTKHSVYLSEESHFDVILGRAFMERRVIKTDPTDPTNIVFLDTGEKIDCELVILKDGKGEIVTVT